MFNVIYFKFINSTFLSYLLVVIMLLIAQSAAIVNRFRRLFLSDGSLPKHSSELFSITYL